MFNQFAFKGLFLLIKCQRILKTCLPALTHMIQTNILRSHDENTKLNITFHKYSQVSQSLFMLTFDFLFSIFLRVFKKWNYYFKCIYILFQCQSLVFAVICLGKSTTNKIRLINTSHSQQCIVQYLLKNTLVFDSEQKGITSCSFVPHTHLCIADGPLWPSSGSHVNCTFCQSHSFTLSLSMLHSSVHITLVIL